MNTLDPLFYIGIEVKRVIFGCNYVRNAKYSSLLVKMCLGDFVSNLRHSLMWAWLLREAVILQPYLEDMWPTRSTGHDRSERSGVCVCI